MILRTVTARSILRSITNYNAQATRTMLNASFGHAQLSTSTCHRAIKHSNTLTLTSRNPLTNALVRYQTTGSIDHKAEQKIAQQPLKPDPEAVSMQSSVGQVSHQEGAEKQEKDVDMLAGVKQDLKTIRDTFALRYVPKEALYVGLAGVLPYLATSLSTVYLAWDINYAYDHGAGLLMDGKTAEVLLHLIEPIQIGYGAIILSFLGAIHWGLEWAGYGGYHGYRRYAYGVIATAVAWPTLLFPVEYALISQFLAFTFLYYADARATVRGWCPSWYSTYRFVLTFFVGASIVASLIGRGRIADKITKQEGPADRMKALRESQLEQLEREEAERRTRIVEEVEEEE